MRNKRKKKQIRKLHINNKIWTYTLSNLIMKCQSPTGSKTTIDLKTLGFGTDREYNEKCRDGLLISKWGTYWEEATPKYIKRVIQKEVLNEDIKIFDKKYNFVIGDQKIKLSEIKYLKEFMKLDELQDHEIKEIEEIFEENKTVHLMSTIYKDKRILMFSNNQTNLNKDLTKLKGI